MKKPELLAPAGNLESLKAAILAGCDAVYLGGKFFGARSFAVNFNDEEIVYAINYAHIYGVKVYVTLNTIVYEKEVDLFMSYVDFLYKNNVDALIIQDIGMMDLVRQVYPNLELHASTQMHIHNVEGVKLVQELGLKRAVIAREIPLELISKIKKETNIELEIFIAGALCVSYSGECLMSSLLNGRSGNRGTCSQCCRMPYDLYIENKKVSKEKYLLSSKDLMTLYDLDKLLKIGVDSLKIEGRMKRKEYVYVVVSLYRKAIDSYFKTGKIKIDEKEIEDLKKIFNRGFTKGFLNNEKSENWINEFRPNHVGIQIGEVIDISKNFVTVKLTHEVSQNDGIRIIGKNDTGLILNKIYQNKKLVNKADAFSIISFYVKDKVSVKDKVLLTTDSVQIKKIDSKLENITRKVIINGYLVCKEGILSLSVDDGVNKIKKISEFSPEIAKNNPTSKLRIEEQILKTGNTPFEFDKLNSEIDDNIFVSIKALNDLRRDILEELKQLRMYKYPYIKKEYKKIVPTLEEEKGKIAYISRVTDIKSDIKEYITSDKKLYNLLKDKYKVYLKLPRVNEELIDHDENLLIGELGSLYKYKNVYTDFSFNVVNSYAVAFLHAKGVKRVTLSYELNDFQIKNIIDAYKKRYNKNPNLELIVSSYPEVMVLKYDLLKGNKEGTLVDINKHKYSVKNENNITNIYHYEQIKKENPEHYFDMGINKIRYDFKN